MKYFTNLKRYTAVGLLALSLFVTACGADPGVKLNNEGNDAYTREAYLEALDLYQNAQIDNPELAEPYYNAANAFYREGQYDQALAQMQQALLYADVDLAQHSYFNLGNNFFNAQDLETAVQSYIEALLLNPDDADAKYNLELALNQQQQQEEQQQEQEQQEQDQEQQQDQSGGEGEEEQENQDQQDQSESGQEGEQDQEQQQDQSDGEGEEEQANQDENNGEESSEGEENKEGEQESDPAQPDQEGKEQDQQNQGQAGQPGEEGGEQEGLAGLQPGEKLSQEQAEQLLAAIANNSQTLQEKLGQILVVPGPPPAQDW